MYVTLMQLAYLTYLNLALTLPYPYRLYLTFPTLSYPTVTLNLTLL